MKRVILTVRSINGGYVSVSARMAQIAVQIDGLKAQIIRVKTGVQLMVTYTYKEYEMPFCGGVGIVTLYVDIYPREEWKDPLEYASGSDMIERGNSGILMRDIVTREDHFCSFDLLAKAFPNLNIYECGFSGGSGVIAKEGHPFDAQQYYEWKKRENLIPPGQ